MFNFGAPSTTPSAITTAQSPIVPSSMPSQRDPASGTPTPVNQAFAPPVAPLTPKLTGPSSDDLRRQAEAKEAVTARKSALLDQIAAALLNERHGLLEQFVEFAVTPMIAQARQQVLDERANQQAGRYRPGCVSGMHTNLLQMFSASLFCHNDMVGGGAR
jgi:hypothetical protein